MEHLREDLGPNERTKLHKRKKTYNMLTFPEKQVIAGYQRCLPLFQKPVFPVFSGS